MIRMTERSLHHQQAQHQQGHDADNEDDDDDVPLGRFRHAHSRFTVKSDGKMRYCQKCKQNFIQVLGPVWYLWLIPVRNSIGNGWSFPVSEFGKQMLERDILESVTVHNGNNHGHNHRDGYYHDSPSPSPAWLAQGMVGSEHEEDDNDDGVDLTLTSTYDSRRDSDGSDVEEGRGFFDPGTPRRFRKGGFAPMYEGSEDEAEEELYDSDEPATIHFSRI
ncbi:hypothetical protein BGZ93_000470 [Podila epicladia]|nr:hypothetical protein BGZ92_009818 [Podila epicladia]KAG0098328.1 hypothetical protein BGZ93_000470 [Podila epicladia]